MIKQTLALVGLTLSVSANAAVVFGSDVKFTYDDSTLFGSAFTVGNSIFFQPTAFRAESTNCQGAVLVSDTLNITAEVITDGYEMTDFALIEQGDYELSAGDTSVTASARLQVTSQTTLCGFIPCIDSDIDNVGGLGTVGATTDWNASSTIDLGDTAGWGSDTLATVQMQNNLSASTLNDGESAWIQKKFNGIGMEVIVGEVPVPAAAWLFRSALIGLAGIKRKK
jgi:hypothetical protein